MKIYSIILPSYNSSDGISVDIFLSGCAREPKCLNCQNPSLWNFDVGQKLDIEKLKKWLVIKDKLYDNICILGGEPLNQDLNELIILLKELSSLNKPIWLYTSYELNEILYEIKKYCSYIKTGIYDENLKTNNNIIYGIQLATKNQKIYKII